MNTKLLWVSALVLTVPAAWSQTAKAPVAKAASAVRKIEISIERKRDGKVERMEPGHVFETGDLVRFRFKATFDGFLYVLNRSTSGRDILLFPKEETGRENRVEKGQEYLLPMTDSGWFQIEPPGGFEVIYWVVTPARLTEDRPVVATTVVPTKPAVAAPAVVEAGTPTVTAPKPEVMPKKALDPTIYPRCDDTIFRARGECIDVTAGPKTVTASELPESFGSLVRPRELLISQHEKTSSVIAPQKGDGPFVYSFRLAHR